MNIELDFNGSLFVVLALLIPVAVVLAYLFYRRTNPEVSPRLRAVLSVLRAVALSLLLFFLMEPILAVTTSVVEKPTVALLIDRSQSMGLIDNSGSRRDRLMTLLRGEVIKGLQGKCGLKSFEFADDFAASDLAAADSIKIVGGGTDIGNALMRAKLELDRSDLSGIILLSDGANNIGEDPVKVAERINVPIYTVGIGDPEGQKDISISRVVTNKVAYVGDQVTFEVTVQSWGYKGARTPIVIAEDEKKLEGQYIDLAGEGREQKVLFDLIPEQPGMHRYEVRIPVRQGELSKENNQQAVFVRVLKSRIRVLLAAGGPSPDLAFLRRSLRRNKDAETEFLVVKKGREFYSGQFPKSEEEIRGFDFVILLDLPRDVLLDGPEELIVRFVKGGGALLVIGGEGSFLRTAGRDGGDYVGSPLSDALPLIMEQGGLSFQRGEFRLELSPEARRHPITRLSDALVSSQKMWDELPPILGINRSLGVKPGATVLAYCRTDRSAEAYQSPVTSHQSPDIIPLIAVWRYGSGKMMVIAFCSFWRWDLMMWGIGKTNQASERFWANAVRWLTREEQISPVEISTDKRAYRGGEKVTFSSQVYDEALKPQEGAKVMVSITGKEGWERKIQLEDLDHGIYGTQLSGLGPGDYKFRGEAWIGDRKIGEGKGEFTVNEYSLEFKDTRADYLLLERIAHRSGGKFYQAEDFPRLPNDLEIENKEIPRTHRVELWNRPWLLAIFVTLLAVEWAVRRRRGMV